MMLQANVDIRLLLHHSIMRPKNSDVSLLLLQHGASVKSKPGDRHRLTVLNRAIIYRQWPVVQYLLDQSQHQQLIDSHSRCAWLHTAARRCVGKKLAFVRKLCRHQVASTHNLQTAGRGSCRALSVARLRCTWPCGRNAVIS